MNFKELCEKSNIVFDDNKIQISSTIKHIKIDIGLSFNAPYSLKWLNNQSDLLVFGFEPNPISLSFLLDSNTRRYNRYRGWMNFDNPYLNKNFFIIPAALSNNETPQTLNFYDISGDEGCSSLFKPNEDFFKRSGYTINKIISVPVFNLSDFFKLLPDSIKYIEHIKIDAQGSDFNIIKGGANFIREKVVWLTIEADGWQYENAEDCNELNIVNYMTEQGFERVYRDDVLDPTFLNLKYKDIADSIWICQK
jgi:FkbM family methyltransferase